MQINGLARTPHALWKICTEELSGLRGLCSTRDNSARRTDRAWNCSTTSQCAAHGILMRSATIIAPFPHRLLTAPPHSTSCRRTETPTMRPKIPQTLYSGLPLVWTCAQHLGWWHMHSGGVINRVVIVYHPLKHHQTHPPYPTTYVA